MIRSDGVGVSLQRRIESVVSVFSMQINKREIDENSNNIFSNQQFYPVILYSL